MSLPYDKTNAVAISCGLVHTAVLLNTGMVMTCGYNSHGQIGSGVKGSVFQKLIPMDISGSSYTGSNAVAISCGSHHTAVLLNTGEVLTCGSNDYGQLGRGTANIGNYGSSLSSVVSVGSGDRSASPRAIATI